AARTLAPSKPTTTTTSPTPAVMAASTTWWIIGRPQSSWSTLAFLLFIRVPCPAARITAASDDGDAVVPEGEVIAAELSAARRLVAPARTRRDGCAPAWRRPPPGPRRSRPGPI